MKKLALLFVFVQSFVFANSPAITVTKTADVDHVTGTHSETTTGDTIVYTITIENTGNVTLTGIAITDTMTDGAGQSLTLTSPGTFSTYTLAPGETEEIEATYTIDQSAADTGSISNTVSVVGTAPDGTEVSDDLDTPVVVSTDLTPSIEVTKTSTIAHSDSDVSVGVGDTINYTITVENTGNTTLTGVTVSDTILDSAGIGLTLTTGPTYDTSNTATEGTLGVGESATYSATFVITQQAVNAGGVSNTASVTSKDPSGTDVTDSTDIAAEDPISRTPAMSVDKTASVDDNGDGITGPGDTINYTITVENTGNVTLTGVYVDDYLTAIAGSNNLVRLLTTEPAFDSASLNSAEGTLKVGEVATYLASYLITNDDFLVDNLSNSVTAYGNDPDGITVDDTNDPTIVNIDANPSFTVTKEVAGIQDDGDGYNGTDDIIDYTITLTNTGNVALTNIALVDVLTNGDGTASTLTPTYDATNTATEGTLQVGETAIYSVQYTIDQAASYSGLVRNTVTVFADDPFGNFLEDSAFVEIPTGASASIEVLKTWELSSDLDSDGIVDDGDTIRFIVSVKNTGNVEVTGITLEDTFSDGAGNLVSFDNGTTTDPRPLNFTVADQASSEGVLLVGETATYEAFYTVTTPVYNTGFVSNSVTAIGYASQGVQIADVSDDGDDTDGNTENDPTVTTFTSQPIDNENILLNGNVYITKSNGLIIKSGDDCFRIKVNNGNVVAEPVNCE